MTPNQVPLNEYICEFTLEVGLIPHKLHLKVPISTPSKYCAKELSYRILELHNIPIYFHKELWKKLDSIIRKKNQEYILSQDKTNINALKSNSIKIEDVAKFWQSKAEQNSKIDSDGKIHKQEELACIYHSLVHSPAVHSLLSLENTFADAVNSLVTDKEQSLQHLQDEQSEAMQEAVKDVGTRLSDDDVNDLASRQLEESQLMEVKWHSSISALKEEQKRDFERHIKKSFEGKEVSTPITPKDWVKRSDFVLLDEPTREESFTIHLGTQMKQMHNLRLISDDVINLFKYKKLNHSDIPPQRIQTSMSLYSHNLNGVVILVDDRVTTYSGIKNEFGNVCGRSSELHFSDLEDQLEKVRNLVPSLVQWRKDHPPPNYECDEDRQSPPVVPEHLMSGDFYVSRHSNLSDVHVVYHVVADDTLRSSDINSRHSVILGLRNVLKAACLCDVTTLTVPLFLCHTLTEEMTIGWCQKRAELVFKCVKGFMIEMASWGGAEMKNLQFLVPKGITDDLFNNLASMLQSIFRLSNPLVVKTSKQEMTS